MRLINQIIEIGVVSLLIGVVASLTASWIAWRLSLRYSRRCYRRKYGRFPGKYEGFGFMKEDGRKLQDQPQSQAVIRYQKDNLLLIELEHNDRKWSGFITMETENYGTVAWRYHGLPNDKREFGLKRCIFNLEEDEIYLIGERPEYGKEVLKRVKQ